MSHDNFREIPAPGKQSHPLLVKFLITGAAQNACSENEHVGYVWFTSNFGFVSKINVKSNAFQKDTKLTI